MDIHKPKPWHGLREFLKEYVIIVVGVLTALGAEQGAEWLHWRHLVSLSEQSLVEETGENLAFAYERMLDRGCHRVATTALRDHLTAQDSRWIAPSPGPDGSLGPRIGRSLPLLLQRASRPWPTQAWEMAVASGVLNHMAPGRAQSYADIYRAVEQIRDRQVAENVALPKLGGLAFDGPITPAERRRYLDTLSELEDLDWRENNRSSQLIQIAAKAGVKLKASKAKQTLVRLSKDYRSACFTEIPIPTAPG